MKCKSCKREIVEHSIYCSWCGYKQIKEKKSEISVPNPVKRGNSWTIQLRKEGWSATCATREECITRAKAIRLGFLENKKDLPKLTVGQCIDRYIEDVQNTLSPSTVKEYKSTRRNHYKAIENEDVYTYNWQAYINRKASERSPKTVENVWHVMTASMRYCKVDVPEVSLPVVPESDTEFLDYQQIQIFLAELYGKEGELEALLALHSLRRSEILELTPKSFDRKKNVIVVRGARVVGETGLVHKDSNKSRKSTRIVPIMIDRIWELIPDTQGYIVSSHQNTPYKRINAACRRAGLPEVGVHGLRRSFASLAYHLKWTEEAIMRVGGWSDINTVHKYYIKLAAAEVDCNVLSMKDFYKTLE